MKIDLVVTDGEGTVKTHNLFRSHDYPKLIADLREMKGISINQEMFTFLKLEMKRVLKYKVDFALDMHEIGSKFWEWDDIR